MIIKATSKLPVKSMSTLNGPFCNGGSKSTKDIMERRLTNQDTFVRLWFRNNKKCNILENQSF